MKTIFLTSLSAILAVSANAGDWGKAPVGKAPIEECVDLGGTIAIGYETDYLYKGYILGGDTVTGGVSYRFDDAGLPLTLSATYANVVSGNGLTNIVNDDLAVALATDLPSFAGIDASLSYTYHFYPEDPSGLFWPSSHGEVGLHLRRDLEVAVVKFDLFYNTGLPNAWNSTIPAFQNSDSGAWFWDLGLEKTIDVMGHGLVLAGGVAYADNYWGTAPNLENGGRSSGWNHYYLRASLPIQLNCRTVLTPYVGYVGAPDSWLLDGAPNWSGRNGQSDTLHGGVNLSVSF